jgi:hypothetical protein
MNDQEFRSQFTPISPSQEAIVRYHASLPPAPSVVTYYDEFQRERHAITHIADKSSVVISTDASLHTIDFANFGELGSTMKLVLCDMLGRLDPTSVVINFNGIASYCSRRGIDPLVTLATSDPHQAKRFWLSFVGPVETAVVSAALRSILHSLCRLSIGEWNPSYREFVKGFMGIQSDKLKTVREGDCFIPSDNLTKIFDRLDDAAANPHALTTEELRDASLMLLNATRGLRPGMLALAEPDDVIVYPDSVQFVVRHIKQPFGALSATTQIRLRQEWSPILVAFLSRRTTMQVKANIPSRLLFGLSSDQITTRIKRFAQEATGEPWNPTDFRHTAAQRNADAGMSRSELQRFLFHKSDYANAVYFRSSPAQAKRINDAMAISPIYGKLRTIAKTKFIKKGELSKLPPDKQIGGMPAGIPLGGIGACAVGQSLCSRHPVLACYSCPKFLPVTDTAIHIEVLNAFREIVKEFVDSAVADELHPAYTQLAPVLHRVRLIIEELSGEEQQP